MAPPSHKLVRAYSASTGLQAHVVRSAFEQREIPTVMRNEMLSSLGGGLPVSDTMVEVWIPESHIEAAREVLALMNSPIEEAGRLSLWDGSEPHGALSVSDAPPPPRPWICKHCGEESPAEFGECWNCQSSLD